MSAGEFVPAARLSAALLAGTMLAGVPVGLSAQETPAAQTPADAAPAAPAPTVQQQRDIVRTISVLGAERLEAQTILSYIRLRPGDTWSAAVGDQVLKDLSATELFATFSVSNDSGNVVITLTENPVINRIILEGNKRIKNDKIVPEIKLAPRQIFTRSKVRADVSRIIELYKRQGRFAATVEPKMVQLAQNRVDIVFEISEGPKSKVRQINVLGNEAFSDSTLRSEMVTKQARLTSFFSSNTSYDPDRLAFDQQKLRQFYLTEGYADFRVVSAVAELTPDKRDFIITYVVEEGERYKFGDLGVESNIRDFDGDALKARLPMQGGDWYDAKLVEDTVEQLTDLAGNFGYAFANVNPRFDRDKETLTMNVNFILQEAPRVYVERVDVNGNTLTQDKVVRREFRTSEGDAFNSLAIKRSTARISSLGYFQENFEVNQVNGSAPDRIVLEANLEEQATGELQLSAGFSSIESFIFQGSIRQRNFRGRGQTIGLSGNISRFSRSANISFTEPYLFDRNISAGVDIFRRDINSFNFLNNDRNTTFEQATTGFSARVGTPLTEFSSIIASYTLNLDDVSLDENQFFADLDGDGILTCEPLIAGRFLCDAIGKRTSSILGLTYSLDTTNSRQRPSRGRNLSVTAEFAGLGGSVQYVRVRGRAGQYFTLGSGFVLSLTAEGGAIRSFEDRGQGIDNVRLTDRFFLGEPQIRGFDIRGVGPRVLRRINQAGVTPELSILEQLEEDRRSIQDDAIGGTAYYLGRAEVEIPLGTGARELGLRPSLFADIGAVFNVTDPILTNGPLPPQIGGGGGVVEELFVGDSVSPRISVGIGVNWNSPFGPFRIDIAKALKSQPGDDTKLFSFNVGTQF